MSQPPPNRYPSINKGVPPLPPFPQLLHLKDSGPANPQRSRSFSGTDIADDESTHQTMSPEEEEIDDAPQKEVKREKKPHATRRRVVQSCSECRRR